MKHKQLENISTHQDTAADLSITVLEKVKKSDDLYRKERESISLESLTHSTEAWLYNLKQEVGLGRL